MAWCLQGTALWEARDKWIFADTIAAVKIVVKLEVRYKHYI